MTTVIAIYAALVASGSLVWQVYAWRHRRQTRVEVQVRLAFAAPAPGVTLEALSITAINRSEHDVRIAGVGVDLPETGEQFHQVFPLEGSTLPGTVRPNDSGNALLRREEVEQAGLDVFEPLTAFVRLATGDEVKSSPTLVRSRD